MIKKFSGILFFLSIISGSAMAQKKVSAVVQLLGTIDSLVIEKGKSFVVQLPIKNRAGDDWELAKPPVNCKFTESYLGEAGMLPNQQEPKLMFFKATAVGVDSIRFLYKNPKKAADAPVEQKLLKLTVQ